jgi:hypothetical protein
MDISPGDGHISLISAGMLILIILMLSPITTKQPYDNINRSIASLERDTSLSGRYYVYFVNADGGYEIGTLSGVILYENSSVTPHYEEYQACLDKINWLNWNGNCTVYKKLFVPEGTIMKEYKG